MSARGYAAKHNLLPRTNLLGAWLTKNGLVDSIGESTRPIVKGSGFAGAGSATVTGLLTTDTITATCATGTAPTCGSNGVLTFGADANCWDVRVTRAGVLWASFPGINVGKVFELDASGNNRNLTALTTTTIIERLDGTGTDYCNESGFSERENIFTTSSVFPSGWGLSDGATRSGNQYTLPVAASYFYTTLVAATMNAATHVVLGISGSGPVGAKFKMDIYAVQNGKVYEVMVTIGADGLFNKVYRFDKSDDTTSTTYYMRIGKKLTDGSITLTMLNTLLSVAQTTKMVSTYAKTIVCEGDSITAGYTYPAKLGALLPGSTVHNVATNGHKIADCIASFTTDIAAKNPHDIVLMIGTNNVATAGGQTNEQIVADYNTLVSMCLTVATGTVFLFELLPFGTATYWDATRQATLEAINANINSLLNSLSRVVVIPVYDLFREPGTYNMLSYLRASDGIHVQSPGPALLADLAEIAIANGRVNRQIITGAYAINGRQPAGFQSFTDNSGKVKLNFTIISGTGPADWVVKFSDSPVVRAILGINNAYFDADGVAINVAYADLGNDVYIFEGTKGVVLYSVNMIVKAASTNRAIGHKVSY